MKIFNRGRGIHEREVPGIERLQAELPDTWRGYTNLELAIPGTGREIDLIMVIEDRIVAVDLKDWRGKIESGDGGWKQNGRQIGDTSPVSKILNNARELHIKLSRFVQADTQRRKLPKVTSPRVHGFVVLTASQDRSGIAPTEVDAVFTIEYFIKVLRNLKNRIETIGGVAPDFHNGELLSADWTSLLSQFFNVRTGAFRPSSRQYGSYKAGSDDHSYRHATGLYAEFNVEDPVARATGLLRRWDFTKAETRFQTEAGRREIAGRERAVLAWLNDRNAACEAAFLQPRAEDPDIGVEYWEVFDRRRKLQRLSDFVLSIQAQGNANQQIELVRQMLVQASLFHELHAAHLDIGAHSVWLEVPSTARFSHLMAASLPEVQTLGEKRYQFLSSASLPEDTLKLSTTPTRKDVFLLSCAAHHLLFGTPPSPATIGEPPDWNPAADNGARYEVLHPWFARGLAWEPKQRFENATEMLAALNNASTATRSPQTVLTNLERFREIQSQRQLLKDYPETQDLRDDQRLAMWRSEHNGRSVVVKMWKREGWGDQAREAPRILAFLEAAEDLILEPIPGFVRIGRALWLGDAIALIHHYEDGTTLEAFLSSDAWSPLAARRDFCLALIDIVTAAHARNVGHGDIKPENIVVRVDNYRIPHPVLLDVLDFSPESDGDRISPAYSPSPGGKFERDRFATTVVIDQVMSAGTLNDKERISISAAISQVRTGPPQNGSLFPLKEVLAQLDRTTPEPIRTVTIALPRAKPGPLLPDEGIIAFRRSNRRSHLIVRGATEQLEFQISPDGTLTNARRLAVEQKRVMPRLEISILMTLHVQDGAFEEFSELEDLLQEPALASILETRPDANELGDADVLPVNDESASEDDESEDELTEELVGENPATTDIDVPAIWRQLMTVEADLKTEGVALGDSSYRRGIARHVVPFQMEHGLLDFDRDDNVLVSRADSSGRWTKLGVLDLHTSNSDLLVVDATRFWRNTDTIVKDGHRLQFTSHYEQTSRSRRREALDRVLARSSRIPDLIDVFDTRQRKAPHEKPQRVDEEEIASTYGLNPVQATAFAALVKIRPLGLLQGPPGTGKTRFIGALVHYALTSGLARNVLLASQSHEAVNGAAEALLRLFKHSDSPSVLRVGHEGNVSEALLPYHVARAETLLKDRFRSQFRERLTAIGQVLGLPSDLVSKLVHVEAVIAPVVERILQLPANDSRLTSLYETLRILSADLLATLPLEDVDDQYCKTLTSRLADEHGVGNAALVARFSEAAQLARDFVNSASSRRRNFESFLAGTRQVVIGTCVGLGRSSLGLTSTPFDLVIVDEAARCTAGELLVPLQAGRWAVLVGDHRQLDPQHKREVVDSVAATSSAPRAEIVRSDFERVFENAYGSKAGFTLTKQYRMLAPIGTVVSDAFYPTALTHGRVEPVIPVDILPSSLASPLTWMFTDKFGPLAYQRETDGRAGALQNPKEAELIAELLRTWDQHERFRKWLETKPTKNAHVIGIICAYRAQADLLRSKLRSAFLSDALRSAVKIDTVDSYQGKENPVVIFSLVRNNEDGPTERGRRTVAPGFMARPNRINVAVSRAMDRLVLVGASERWKEDSPLGKVVAAFARQQHLGFAASVDGAAFLEQLEADRSPSKPRKAKAPTDGSGTPGAAS